MNMDFANTNSLFVILDLNFLKIGADGHVEVFDWCGEGRRSNPTVILDQ